QFSKANNAPLGAALAVTAMIVVGLVALTFVLLNRRWLRRQT
ncbi:MAG: ABC transporter permease, partial [Alphaproteobacteria bacterium]|nr:ABC transporter permease [Alphaproteobacteria bacterium]